ncbi:replication-relaxation family protein [Krasilnikovia sp. M28-CT-15]|uniref:replication-relaxation family protein n=1 Tax=Krasilnikovia sp. M28-CT-15 TaxID=3373540 RepID=UPI00399D3B84
MAGELGRLTPRDRFLLDLLDQHKTFTTDQLVDLAFGSVGRARNRLNTLHSRNILDRFRHYQRPGSQAWRWTLGPVGAALIAAGHGDPLPRPAAVRDATARLAMSPTLGHLLTTNGFFVALTAHAHTDPSTRLDRWWNEARCREQVGAVVRPDGHGVWNVGGRAVPFWLEVDLGTETLSRVVGKLTGYAALPTSRAYPVLFWFPTGAREQNFHTHLTRTGVPDAVTVATAADYAADTGGPAGPVWRVAGHPGRISIADLAPTGDGDRGNALQDRWHPNAA